eukprot:TRINITY_DN8715_c0_g1_i3.p2 TRINITY_DN8715_c0_g1~~TRINITY_DN8715_c0_g1_i3.p2  ORF type:complete len:228 (+),score=56.10 TRINITY_DN8715_c0_g1_i3:1289-1972(+)
MFEYHAIVELWKTDKIELLLFLISFFGCLFLGIEFGMIIAVLTSIFYLLFMLARPGDRCEVVDDVFKWRYDGPLCFNATNHFGDLFWKRFEKEKTDHIQVIVFDLQLMTFLDATGIAELEQLHVDLRQRNYFVHFVNVRKIIFRTIWEHGFAHVIGLANIHFDCPPDSFFTLTSAPVVHRTRLNGDGSDVEGGTNIELQIGEDIEMALQLRKKQDNLEDDIQFFQTK